MKKLLVLFALLFSITLFCNDVNAQSSCSSVENRYVGDVAQDGTFQFYVNPGESLGGTSANLSYVGMSGKYAVYRLMGPEEPGQNVLIGVISTLTSKGRKCYEIYANVR